MMSAFRGEGDSKMTPKNCRLEGKNWTSGGKGGSKMTKKIGHFLWMFPYDYETGLGFMAVDL